MQAFEFVTYVKKDGIIRLPERLNKFKDKKIKIIIMAEDLTKEDFDKKQRVNKFKHFQDFIMKNTKDLQFDNNIDIDRLADEINEVRI